jgi:hypothetical protein
MSQYWLWILLMVAALVFVGMGLLGMLGPEGRGDPKDFWYFEGGAIAALIGIVGCIRQYLSSTPFF